jgi:drug/metabolite transporter (DMT)-like permease
MASVKTAGRDEVPAGGRHGELRGIAWGLAAAFLTAGWWVVTRRGVTASLDQLDVAALRFAVSGLLLSPVLWRHRRKLGKASKILLAVMAVCAGAPYSLVAGTALTFAPAASGGALVGGLMPLFVALLSMLVLKEPIGAARCLGLGIVVAGVVGLAGTAAASSAAMPLFVLASLMSACFTVALRRSGLPPLAAISLVCFVSGLTYIPCYLILFGRPFVPAAPVAEVLQQALYQGALSAIVASYCFARAVMLLGPARAALFGALVPVLACLLGAAVLAECPTSAEAAAIGTIAAGTVLASGAVRVRAWMPAFLPALR